MLIFSNKETWSRELGRNKNALDGNDLVNKRKWRNWTNYN